MAGAAAKLGRKRTTHGISPSLVCRWRDEAEAGAKALAGSPAAGETEKDERIQQLERTLGRKSLEIEIVKKRCGGVSCSVRFTPRREKCDPGLHGHAGAGDVDRLSQTTSPTALEFGPSN
jgi:hypothetical protein